MLDDTPTGPEAAGDTAEQPPAKKAAARKSAAKKATTPRKTAAKKTAPTTEAGDAATAPVPDPAAPDAPASAEEPAPAKKAAARKSTAKTAAKKTTTPRKTAAKKTTAPAATAETPAADPAAPSVEGEQQPAAPGATTVTTTTRSTRKRTTKTAPSTSDDTTATPATDTPAAELPAAAAVPLFQAPEATTAPARRTRSRAAAKPATEVTDAADAEATTEEAAGEAAETAAPTRSRSTQKRTPRAKPEATDEATDDDAESAADSGDTGDSEDSESGEGPSRRRRRRGGRRRRKSGGGESGGDQQDSDGRDSGSQDDSGQKSDTADKSDKNDKSGKNEKDDRDSGDDKDSDDGDSGSTSRRRRRRRRAGEDGDNGDDDPQNTVTRVRKQRSAEDQITAVSGSTRLEAKKQRRREGREAGRRRAPIVSEAEFLARRESVERVMAIRQRDDLTQIAVLEDKVLVEHYVARESQTSLIGNVYLGRVQNVLPSMEAAFIDIGKGRNAVLYAGEVNWSALGHKDGQPRKIESVLSSGQMILVQVTKDPVGHKGARLTSQISLAGRFLVYVPDGTNSGISRKLPDTERNRLKTLLKEIVPDGAGVIVRTAAEGASEEELTRDVERLRARWEDIEKKSANKGAGAQLLYGEPDLTLKVVRDLFTEDFSRLVIQGDDAWDTVHDYVAHVAPDLGERLEKYDGSQVDLFAKFRIDEQIHKGLDRKVWLPSGGSLVIDRTEAMTVVDVNTGKFTGSGGNLEETVTKNNLEAAEEIVRQLRLRDIGGIIVVDFIDMVLESNRDLVLRRLVECLGRDRTRHQVAEVTSLGLVQMTRKRIGTGLLEAFSENCEHCQGRGVVIADAPVEPKREQEPKRSTRRRGGKGRDDQDSAADQNGKQGGQQAGQQAGESSKAPSPKDVAAMARAAAHAEEEAAAPEAVTDTEAESVTPREPDAEPQPEPQPEPVSTEPKVSTRTRSRTRTPAKARPEPEPQSETAPETEPEMPSTVEPEARPEPAPIAEQPELPAEQTTSETTEPPAEPAAPKVVTRTRRRSASRPAGPPATPVAAESPAPPTVTAAAEPGGASAAPVPAMTPTGGSAEPGTSGVVGAPPADGAVEPGTAETEVGTKPVVEHVPVKKRGSRKR